MPPAIQRKENVDTPREGALLVVLCGIPGSGKSTLAGELIRRLGDVEVIATDVIGGKRGRYEKLRRRLAEVARSRRHVVLDGTFYARRHREAVRSLGRPTLLVYLDCPLEVCRERNRERGFPVPDAAVRGILGRFEPPGPDERPLRIRTDRVPPAEAARRVYREVVRMRLPGTRGDPRRERPPERGKGPGLTSPGS